jgi:hypothetical protein
MSLYPPHNIIRGADLLVVLKPGLAACFQKLRQPLYAPPELELLQTRGFKNSMQSEIVKCLLDIACGNRLH